MTEFGTIVVVGLGLIGGSLAAAAKRLDPAPRILGVNRRPEPVAYALEHGLIDEGASPDEAVARGWFSPGTADAVVLSTPAHVAEDWMRRLGELGYAGVVTDVASTKSGVTDAARRWLGPQAQFVGGHPMAGSELSGVEAARADLFEGAYYVLTPTADTDMNAYRRMHTFASALGARVLSVDATAHDEAVAAISHVPHMAAAAIVNLAADRATGGEDLLRLAAGGFKDTTRIAAGSPDLWTGISFDNADAVVAGIGELMDILEDFATRLATGDEQGVRAWLARAAEVRKSLPAQWVPATTQLTEVVVPVIDRPGVIGEVTTAVSRAGCNIEDIEIDHTSEDTALLRLVLTDEGDIDGFVSTLAALGYSPRRGPLTLQEG